MPRWECKCENCKHYDNDEEYCNLLEQDVFSHGWCMNHGMDWDKERGGK
ncbi:MAG: hypothetical protein H6Q67_1486 [Firmicutes bacterium]|nr:hypothetical protein [Bacillota bacterium]